ncbi:MAG: response regulator [Candidatus Rokuibacteriota bacterium]
MAGLRSKILVVDDEPATLATFAEYLQSEGFEVATAGSGSEALAALDLEKPDGILLDVLMPDMTGIDVLRQIRAKNFRVGVLMVTAVDDTTTAREAQALGAFGYVLKPVDFDVLRRNLDRMLIASSMPAAQTAPTSTGGSPVYDFTLELFKVTRGLPPAIHASLGVALEAAALTVLQRSSAGEKTELGRSISHVRTLIRLGRDLGDFSDDVYQRLDSSAVKVRQSFGFS